MFLFLDYYRQNIDVTILKISSEVKKKKPLNQMATGVMICYWKNKRRCLINNRPLFWERQVFISSCHLTSLDYCCRYGRNMFSWLSAFLVLIRRSHRVNPTLECFLFLFHDPGSSLKLKLLCFFSTLNYLVSNGVHMGSNQVLPAFFTNFSSFLAPVFFMVVSPLFINNGLYSFETYHIVMAGPVSCYRLPQDVFLRIEFDSLGVDGRHGL